MVRPGKYSLMPLYVDFFQFYSILSFANFPYLLFLNSASTRKKSDIVFSTVEIWSVVLAVSFIGVATCFILRRRCSQSYQFNVLR